MIYTGMDMFIYIYIIPNPSACLRPYEPVPTSLNITVSNYLLAFVALFWNIRLICE